MRKSSFTAAATFALLILVIAGCGKANDSSSLTAPSTTTAPPAPVCKTTDLTASLAPTPTEQMRVVVQLKNTSSTPCSLSGVPTVRIMNKADAISVSPEQNSSNAGNVNIAPNQYAYAAVTYVNQSNATSCSPGKQITIAPPGNDQTLVVPFTLNEVPSICADSTATAAPVSSRS